MRNPYTVQAPTSITATGGLSDFIVGGFTRFITFLLATLNTAGTAPTLTVKLQQADPAVVGTESYTVVGATDNKLFSASTTNNKLAAKFTKSGANSIVEVALMLQQIGTIAAGATLTVQVCADSSGPSTVLGTTTLDINSTVPTAYAYVSAVFAIPVDLADATVYWIVISPSYSASSTNCVEWRSGTVGSAGNFSSNNGTSWTATTTTSLEFVALTRTYTDVTNGGFTQVTGTLGQSVQTLNFDAHTFKKHCRPYATIGGSSSPAFATTVQAVAESSQPS